MFPFDHVIMICCCIGFHGKVTAGGLFQSIDKDYACDHNING